jgi:hypothetical protein
MRLSLSVLVALLFVTRVVSAQLVAAPDANPVGTWRGTSRCVVIPSDCKDAVVVLRIAQTKAGDSLSVAIWNVVDAREDNFGLLACDLNAARAFMTCTVDDGRWRFTVRHDSLVGQQRVRGGTWFREIRAVRSREPRLVIPGEGWGVRG